MWDPFVADLSADFRLILVDMRGHGGSDNPSGRFTHQLAAQDLLGLMDALDIDRFSGVGHSSGAVTLLEAAVMQPHRVEGLVLLAGAHRFTDDAREGLRNPDPDGFRRTYPRLYEAVTSSHPGGAQQFRDLMAQLPQLAADPGLTAAELASVTTPALVAFGDRDEINPVSLAVELYELLPQAELWVMPNTLHSTVFEWEFLEDGQCPGCQAAAKAFPDVVTRFLKAH